LKHPKRQCFFYRQPAFQPSTKLGPAMHSMSFAI
jgi:hypothetical protein